MRGVQSVPSKSSRTRAARKRAATKGAVGIAAPLLMASQAAVSALRARDVSQLPQAAALMLAVGFGRRYPRSDAGTSAHAGLPLV